MRSFVLFAAHDSPHTTYEFRGFTEFRLMAYNDDTMDFDIMLATFNPTSPYDPPTGGLLQLALNVPETTATRFRAEFDQAAIPSNRAGPRILELDAFGTAIPEPTTGSLWVLGLGALLAVSRIKRVLGVS